jgi:hypothetical protein
MFVDIIVVQTATFVITKQRFLRRCNDPHYFSKKKTVLVGFNRLCPAVCSSIDIAALAGPADSRTGLTTSGSMLSTAAVRSWDATRDALYTTTDLRSRSYSDKRRHFLTSYVSRSKTMMPRADSYQNIMDCRPVARQRPRKKQLYSSHC